MKPFSRKHLKDALCLSVLALLIVIVFWPALFNGRILLPSDQFDTMTLPYSSGYVPPQAFNHNLTDGLMQSYPWMSFDQAALRAGDLHRWNPKIFDGYAQYANSRQFFDIFHLILIPVDLPFAFQLIIVLQLFTAGFGMFVLLRVHKLRRIVAMIFAIAWTFNGMFLTHLINLWALSTFCWLPFALAMCLEYHRKQSLTYLIFAGIFFGLTFLGSTLQSAVYAFVCLVIVNAGWANASKNRLIRTAVFSIVVPTLIALFLAAIMFVPSIEMFLETIKHGSLYSPTHGHPYGIIDRLLSAVLLITFFAPEIMGIVRSISLTSIAGVHPLDFSGYLSFFEMLMGVWTLFSLRLSDRSVRPYAWLVAAGFLLPVFTPLFAWLYHRFFIVGTLGLTVLGAERFNSFIDNETVRKHGRRWAKYALRFAVTAFILLIAINLVLKFSASAHNIAQNFLIAHSSGSAYSDGNAAWVAARIAGTFEHYSVLSPMMLIPFCDICGVCLILLYWPLSIKQIRFGKRFISTSEFLAVALFILSCVQNVFWWRSFQPMLDPKEFPLLPTQSSITFLQDNLGQNRAFIDRRSYPGHQYLFLDNMPSFYGISTISGYESEVPQCFYPYVRLIFPSSPHPHALGLMAVKYLMFVRGVVLPGTLPVADSGAAMIYSNPFVRPRATLYYSSETLPADSTVIQQIFDESDPHQSVLFTRSDADSMQVINSTESWDSSTIEKDEYNAVSIIASPRRPAYLVLSDSYYPGWKCYVDGSERPVIRANYAMRAVFLEAGTHHISFVFRPVSAIAGEWISMSAFIVLLCAGIGTLISNIGRRRDK